MEMTLREMQVDGGLFQVAMSEEDLNGAQVSALFEQVGSKTVAQGVGMNPILEAGMLRSAMAGMPHGPGADGAMGGVMTSAGE